MHRQADRDGWYVSRSSSRGKPSFATRVSYDETSCCLIQMAHDEANLTLSSHELPRRSQTSRKDRLSRKTDAHGRSGECGVSSARDIPTHRGWNGTTSWRGHVVLCRDVGAPNRCAHVVAMIKHWHGRPSRNDLIDMRALMTSHWRPRLGKRQRCWRRCRTQTLSASGRASCTAHETTCCASSWTTRTAGTCSPSCSRGKAAC